MDLETWAIPQISRLLPLDQESLKQIINYADTLTKEGAAEHLKNLLGDSAQSLEFITSFNSRRQAIPTNPTPAIRPTSGPASEVSKAKSKKKKAGGFNKLPTPRQPEGYGDTSGGYIKRNEEENVAGTPRQRKEPQLSSTLELQDKPDLLALPTPQTGGSTHSSPRLPPSAAGPLISDVKPSRDSSRNASRNASPNPKGKTKISIAGGTSMHGQSSTINDLDSAIRSLEIQTNPSLSSSAADNAKRRCNCMATRHPLLDAAPNCMNCGKIICVKEGLGPCTFCEKPLLSSADIQSMVRVLREERGKEKMSANNAVHKRAEISGSPRPFSGLNTPLSSSVPSSDSESEKLAVAKQHRDKLLNFQAQNARRTRIHDEAADFETPSSGTNMWTSPQERALQLKRQQKILREQEWSARPEYEKRKVVASIDLVGGKIVKRMAAAERPKTPDSNLDENDFAHAESVTNSNGGVGAFSKNPLLGSMIRPVARSDPEGERRSSPRTKETAWRRVQDDHDDNEQWILDGGVYGGKETRGEAYREEPSCG